MTTNKDEWKKKILKIFFLIMAETPKSSVGYSEDCSAYEIGFKTELAKFHIRVYEDQILVFTNRKDGSVKKFDTYTPEVEDFIKEIIQDSRDKF